METMTHGRVYAVVDRGEVKSVVYFDNQNKRSKQIDLADHHGMSPHTHAGYLHNEGSPNGKPMRLSTDERKIHLATRDNQAVPSRPTGRLFS